MYLPAAFHVEDRETLFQFLEDNPFATLVTHHHGEEDHLAFLERPFQEAAAAIQKYADEGYNLIIAHGVEFGPQLVEIVKALCTEKAAEWGKFEFEETKIGRLEHKIEKLQIVRLVPGVEWIRPHGLSGDHGITMEEHTPFGVIGAITPVTHSLPTITGNSRVLSP